MPDTGLLSVCLNPVLQRTVVLDALREGDVNRALESRVDASGKGVNVTRVLTELGARATHLTQAGGCQRELFLDLVRSDGIDIEWVESGSEIRWCTTLVSRSAATTTEIVEEAVPVAPETESRIRAVYERLVPSSVTVVFSGTKAAGFSDALYPDLVERARGAGVRVILDVKGSDLVRSLDFSPEIAKPNFDEFVATFLPDASRAPRDAALEQRVRELLTELTRRRSTAFVLTRGSAPALLAEGGRVWERSGERVQPLNATGSGDAFTAALALALTRGASLDEAVEQGHWAGARNAERLRPGVIR
jgi:1-phosphofructokinase/tagatose 6-phosphate kinase